MQSDETNILPTDSPGEGQIDEEVNNEELATVEQAIEAELESENSEVVDSLGVNDEVASPLPLEADGNTLDNSL